MIFLDRVALDKIRSCCPNKSGFEDAFAQATWFFVRDLVDCIDNHITISRSTYDEPIDFLDGNGFKVEGNEETGYTISLLNT